MGRLIWWDLMHIRSSEYHASSSARNARLLTTSRPAIQLAEVNLETGELGEWITLWKGTGGLVSISLSAAM